MFCPYCNSNLLPYHLLEDPQVSPMKNGAKILYPKCASCGTPIRFADVRENMEEHRNILLITGTAGAGKTALGQMIESKHNYIFVDGDAIQKRVNFYARLDPSIVVGPSAQYAAAVHRP